MDQGTGGGSVRQTAPDAEQPMARVHEGMKVIDAAGDDVGKVTDLKMGDPQATTALGEHRDEGAWGAGVFSLLSGGGQRSPAAEADPNAAGGPDVYPGEPHVPLTVAGRLLREGYLKIDGGLFHGDYYAAATTVQTVSAETVQLSVTKDQLPKA